MNGRNNLAFKSESQNWLIVAFMSNSNTSASYIVEGIACGGSYCFNRQHFVCDSSATHIVLL